jgi:hypothetical protein
VIVSLTVETIANAAGVVGVESGVTPSVAASCSTPIVFGAEGL